MSDPRDEPEETLDEMLARSRDRAARYSAWLDQLRAGDPTFDLASDIHPWDFSEWQSGVYLLTGCEEIWGKLGGEVTAERSIAPVLREIDEPRRAWSSSEDAVMAWAAHFWDVGQRKTAFPYVFKQFYFQRWITACHLRQKIPPALTIIGDAR